MPSRLITINSQEAFDQSVREAAAVVSRGGLIVYPTDTLYGIGADPRNENAVRTIHEAKQREGRKPILLLADSVESALPLIRAITPNARALIDVFWPGPLTLIFDASSAASSLLTMDGNTVGIRVPDNAFCLSLLRLLGHPLTSTSANITGKGGQSVIGDIRADMGDRIDLYIDNGPLHHMTPSTIVDVSTTRSRLLRRGVISVERLLAVDHTLMVDE
jgi:L-threonylcarbamoyladenylate synthase